MTDYLDRAGLTEPLRAARLPHRRLRLHDLHRQQRPAARSRWPQAVREGDLVAAAVLSGNRNFEGRVNPLVKANYLASPPLVVAYALAGTTDIDLTSEPLGQDPTGPAGLPAGHLADRRGDRAGDGRRRCSRRCSASATPTPSTSNERWNEIEVSGGELYEWDAESTYIQEPPFLVDLTRRAGADRADSRARACWRCWAIR